MMVPERDAYALSDFLVSSALHDGAGARGARDARYALTFWSVQRGV